MGNALTIPQKRAVVERKAKARVRVRARAGRAGKAEAKVEGGPTGLEKVSSFAQTGLTKQKRSNVYQ